MAIIKFGGLVSEVRGKVGGVVFARNKGGAYVRNFAAPTATATPARAVARVAFGDLAKEWENLTPEQRMGWDDYARVVGTRNSFGEQVPISGIAAFIRGNSIFAFYKAVGRIGGAATIKKDPPATMTQGPMFLLSQSDMVMEWSETSPPVLQWDIEALTLTEDPASVEVAYSPIVNPGRQSYSGLPFRRVHYSGVAGNEPYTDPIPPELAHVGASFFVRFRAASYDARLGDPVYFRVTVPTQD